MTLCSMLYTSDQNGYLTLVSPPCVSVSHFSSKYENAVDKLLEPTQKCLTQQILHYHTSFFPLLKEQSTPPERSPLKQIEA